MLFEIGLALSYVNRRPLILVLLTLAGLLVLAVGVRGYHQGTTRRHGRTSHHHRYPSPPVAYARPTSVPSPSPEAGATPAGTPTAPTPVPRDRLEVARTAIAAQGDPARLATLGSRGANPRLKRIVFYLALARDAGADPGQIIEEAQRQNGSAGTPRAELVKAGLLRNLKIADGLGLLTPDNRARLRRGAAPVVTRGPYAGQHAEVDHVVPRALARELDHELANLELLPARLNRQKSARVGERQLDYARRFRDAGLISAGSFARVQAAYRPAGTAAVELAVP